MEKTSLKKEVAGNHYQQFEMQPIELIADMDWDFFQGNIAKYALRAKFKNGQQDIDKAIHYCELAIELTEPDDGCEDWFGGIKKFVETNKLNVFWKTFLGEINHKNYELLKEMLTDTQCVKNYFL